ncbi:hypothetical protein RIR_jg873.t1 [Rhizophagus irregularis DAOM 181602=DAOM 197198]|nr:hypothetical protein RIR_jg873.t1 [Rhizophagus irregularis DAOM 181602=DAOM 197198]
MLYNLVILPSMKNSVTKCLKLLIITITKLIFFIKILFIYWCLAYCAYTEWKKTNPYNRWLTNISLDIIC